MQEISKKLHKEGKLKPIPKDFWIGRNLSEDHKQNISKGMQGKQNGNRNSQYGTCWIVNEQTKECLKIKQEDLEIWINKGYKKGRK